MSINQFNVISIFLSGKEIIEIHFLYPLSCIAADFYSLLFSQIHYYCVGLTVVNQRSLMFFSNKQLYGILPRVTNCRITIPCVTTTMKLQSEYFFNTSATLLLTTEQLSQANLQEALCSPSNLLTSFISSKKCSGPEH